MTNKQHTHKLSPPKNAHQRELLAEYDRRCKQLKFTQKNYEKATLLLQATMANMSKEGMLVKLEEAPIERNVKEGSCSCTNGCKSATCDKL